MPTPNFVKEIVTEEFERGLLRATLDFTGSDLNKTANILGIRVESLKEKIDSYDICKMAS